MVKDASELTTHCIRCGFCLESCPTYVETGNEMESPRGRIYLVRSALEGKLRWQEDVKEHLDLCLGCRACETACPSGVEYGAILEIARSRIEEESPILAKKALLALTTNAGLMRAQLALGHLVPGRRVPGFFSKWVSGETAEVDRPEPQATPDYPVLVESSLPAVRGEVYLLEGCAMRVLFPRVHAATRRLLRRVGFVVRETSQGCCGSLYAHNGYLDKATAMLSELRGAFSADLPVIVNSAGCGSWMRDNGFPRSLDVSEFLLAEGLVDALRSSPGMSKRVTYHDACHLAHGQRVTSPPRELLRAIPGLSWVDLAESDMCCGSAGIYNVTQPLMARQLLDRKFANIEATGAEIVAMGNPGCHAWIAQGAREHGGAVRVMHTAEVLEASFSGLAS